VSISGVTGSTVANGTWIATNVISNTSFDLRNSVGDGNMYGVGSGTWTLVAPYQFPTTFNAALAPGTPAAWMPTVPTTNTNLPGSVAGSSLLPTSLQPQFRYPDVTAPRGSTSLAPGGEFDPTTLRSVIANLQPRVDLNRTLRPYPTPDATTGMLDV